MADYTTRSRGGGRWLIFAGIAVALVIIVTIFMAAPTTHDPATMPDTESSAEPVPAPETAPDN